MQQNDEQQSTSTIGFDEKIQKNIINFLDTRSLGNARLVDRHRYLLATELFLKKFFPPSFPLSYNTKAKLTNLVYDVLENKKSFSQNFLNSLLHPTTIRHTAGPISAEDAISVAIEHNSTNAIEAILSNGPSLFKNPRPYEPVHRRGGICGDSTRRNKKEAKEIQEEQIQDVIGFLSKQFLSSQELQRKHSEFFSKPTDNLTERKRKRESEDSESEYSEAEYSSSDDEESTYKPV